MASAVESTSITWEIPIFRSAVRDWLGKAVIHAYPAWKKAKRRRSYRSDAQFMGKNVRTPIWWPISYEERPVHNLIDHKRSGSSRTLFHRLLSSRPPTPTPDSNESHLVRKRAEIPRVASHIKEEPGREGGKLRRCDDIVSNWRQYLLGISPAFKDFHCSWRDGFALQWPIALSSYSYVRRILGFSSRSKFFFGNATNRLRNWSLKICPIMTSLPHVAARFVKSYIPWEHSY